MSNVQFLVFRNFDNAIRCAKNLKPFMYTARSGYMDFGDAPVIDVYNEQTQLTHRFVVSEALHAVASYFDQGD